jgi:hypothetical protein
MLTFPANTLRVGDVIRFEVSNYDIPDPPRKPSMLHADIDTIQVDEHDREVIREALELMAIVRRYREAAWNFDAASEELTKIIGLEPGENG